MKTLTIVCPVYNEEAVIEVFYRELKKVLINISDNYDSTMLFVVDRCQDNTLDILKAIAAKDPKVRILSLSARFGHQMSLVAGIDNCDSDAIVMLDSDLQHPPELIPRLLQNYEQGYEIIYTLRQDSPEMRSKRTAQNFFYRILNYISVIPINENAADYRLITRKVAKVFQTQIRERNQFLRGLFNWVGFRSMGVPFEVKKRLAGKSKYSLSRMIRFAIDGIVAFSRAPLRAAILIGFIFAAIGFLLAFITTLQFFFQKQLFPAGWATLVVIICIFSGTQLIFLGVIGEYIGAIFDEVKNRPHYIISVRTKTLFFA